MKELIVALCLFFPIHSYSAEPQSTNFNDYKNITDRLAAECTSKGMQNFSGFCISKKYDDQTKTSITIALQLISFEYFNNKCESSDFSDRNGLLAQALKIDEAKLFVDEMKPQKEALEAYSNHFDFCKTKEENSLAVSNKLKWFEYMSNKYSSKVLTSNQPARKVVGCILDKYKGAGFFADGLLTADGSISIQLFAPVRVILATVENKPEGSITRYINVKNSNGRVIPQADTFDNAVNKCQ
ncbi:hypothetical protein V8G57_20930 [Collimonas sp. H4R21]|uniref:Uncharacterized protein n=1 Tax=Collimonas rhizosphaerae TaxID=3126357 RepID=A0ABU9Q0U3_9BURK